MKRLLQLNKHQNDSRGQTEDLYEPINTAEEQQQSADIYEPLHRNLEMVTTSSTHIRQNACVQENVYSNTWAK